MTVADTFALACSNLARRKGRTTLTAAGVVIGVASLVLMVSLGLGVKQQVLKFFETDEALRMLTVHRVRGESGKKRGSGAFGFGLDGQMVPLTDKDLDDLRKTPGVARVRPDLNMILRVAVEGEKGAVPYGIEGLLAEEEEQYSRYIISGGVWSRREERSCLVPDSFLETRTSLKPEAALGRKVTFTGFLQDAQEESDADVFTIVGILDAEKLGFKGRQIFLPMEHALSLRERKAISPLLPSKRGTYLSAELFLTNPRLAEDVARRLRNSGYNTLSTVEIIKQINVVFLIIEGLLACIGAIGLVVSLFGIANTMAMAVLERTREIGIMKALGARNGDVGRLFLAEAAVIGAFGGGIGLAGGALVGKVLNALAHPLLELPAQVSLFYVSLWLAAGSVLFSILISVLAGWLPARRAARMLPVAALRYE